MGLRQKKVAAVIVTYNRKHLLLKCIESVRNQSRKPDIILIVDNASNDGTLQFLKDRGFADDALFKIINLRENVGGAGGFCVGVSLAVEMGFDWVWLMDDDGYAHVCCLEKLLQGCIQEDVVAISPLVVEAESENINSFPFAYKDLKYNIKEIKKIKFIPLEAHLFNGFLASSGLFSRIGLPRKEFFIRGDEVEFCYRMLKNSIRFGTLTSAIFYHPSDASERFRLCRGLVSARCASSDFKNYYLYRNKAFMLREKGMYWVIPVEAVKYFYFFMIEKKLDFRGFNLWLSATRDGILGKLGKNESY